MQAELELQQTTQIDFSLIEVKSNGRVEARNLYQFLGYDLSNWSRWHQKNISQNEFAFENEDFWGFVTVTSGNEIQDFELSVTFAKKLCMMARTQAGENARGYFIECEKKAQSQSLALPQNYESALEQLLLSVRESNQLKLEAEKNKPLVEFANCIAVSTNSITIQNYSKLLPADWKLGEKNLFKLLRDNQILMYDNQPYQQYISNGYFEVKEKTYLTPYRGQQSYTQTKITGKGQIYLSNKLKKLGYTI